MEAVHCVCCARITANHALAMGSSPHPRLESVVRRAPSQSQSQNRKNKVKKTIPILANNIAPSFRRPEFQLRSTACYRPNREKPPNRDLRSAQAAVRGTEQKRNS